VTVITSADDYARVLEDMKNNDGAVTYETRKQLAANAFALTAAYDSNISNWLAAQIDKNAYPRSITFAGNLKQVLRYGENPHQSAALYTVDDSNRPGAARAQFLQGKELSYNNLNDTNAAFELVSEFSDPTVAIIKHANPCGVATGKNMLDAYKQALRCDPVSAFGGIIALNRPLDKDTAAEIIKIFVEVIIAPSVEPAALEILKKKDKIRVLATNTMPGRETLPRVVTRIAGGFLVQDADNAHITKADLKVVTKRAPTEKELNDMLFAFTVANT
jgi:phosphoribosylaminoimidazolecarboxamide formyltransferase/IMP cyclohydrolase